MREFIFLRILEGIFESSFLITFAFLFKILECKSIGYLQVEEEMVPFILEPEGFGVNSAHVSTQKDLARNMGRGS